MIPPVSFRLVHAITLALPVEDYRLAFPLGRGGFVLDSRTHAGDFTLLGGEPTLAFRAYRSEHRLASGVLAARTLIGRPGDVAHVEESEDALKKLADLLAEHAVPRAANAPLPFLGGAVGYIGYEAGQMLERLPCRRRPGIGLPDVAFCFHDWVLGRCNRTHRGWLSVTGRGLTVQEARASAEQTSRRVEQLLCAFEHAQTGSSRRHAPRAASRDTSRAGAESVTSQADYLRDIGTAKRHIEDGDAFEICLTRRLDATFTGDPFVLWCELRKRNPSPYATFLDLPEGAVATSSPERFLSLSSERLATSRPIKGTRPRGKTAEEDVRLADELSSSIKDRAENAMIVDLVRNDLGRVCRFGSVETPELFAVESYATVHQLVSTICGTLREDVDRMDLIRACFPPGSMTGAPKIEAMKILEALEPTERGVYAGALGWLDDDGTMDLSVVIRSIFVRHDRAHVHVGGAIVADSDPDAEFQETRDKAHAMLEALGTVRPRDPSIQHANDEVRERP